MDEEQALLDILKKCIGSSTIEAGSNCSDLQHLIWLQWCQSMKILAYTSRREIIVFQIRFFQCNHSNSLSDPLGARLDDVALKRIILY